ncbi:MAG: hypothetical protein ABI700_05960 [Chloroflexota bacterium]
MTFPITATVAVAVPTAVAITSAGMIIGGAFLRRILVSAVYLSGRKH